MKEVTVKPLLSPLGGAYLFQPHLRGSLIETEGLIQFSKEDGISSP